VVGKGHVPGIKSYWEQEISVWKGLFWTLFAYLFPHVSYHKLDAGTSICRLRVWWRSQVGCPFGQRFPNTTFLCLHLLSVVPCYFVYIIPSLHSVDANAMLIHPDWSIWKMEGVLFIPGPAEQTCMENVVHQCLLVLAVLMPVNGEVLLFGSRVYFLLGFYFVQGGR
jgi:hypothetical protein